MDKKRENSMKRKISGAGHRSACWACRLRTVRKCSRAASAAPPAAGQVAVRHEPSQQAPPASDRRGDQPGDRAGDGEEQRRASWSAISGRTSSGFSRTESSKKFFDSLPIPFPLSAVVLIDNDLAAKAGRTGAEEPRDDFRGLRSERRSRAGDLQRVSHDRVGFSVEQRRTLHASEAPRARLAFSRPSTRARLDSRAGDQRQHDARQRAANGLGLPLHGSDRYQTDSAHGRRSVFRRGHAQDARAQTAAKLFS